MDYLNLVSCALVLFTIQKAFGVDHTLQGWEATAVNVSGYRRSKMVFSVGDGLVFKMDNGEADIAHVSESDYELCSPETPKAIYRAGPAAAAIYLNKTGNWYFISRAPEHCKSGKKLMVTVVAASSNNRKKNNNDIAGFGFAETTQRKGFGGGGRGRGGGGGTGGGSAGSSIPKGYKNRLPARARRHVNAAPRLCDVDLKSLVTTLFFCSALLAGPLLV